MGNIFLYREIRIGNVGLRYVITCILNLLQYNYETVRYSYLFLFWKYIEPIEFSRSSGDDMYFQNFPSALSRKAKKTNPQQRQNGNVIETNTNTGGSENVQFKKMSIV